MKQKLNYHIPDQQAPYCITCSHACVDHIGAECDKIGRVAYTGVCDAYKVDYDYIDAIKHLEEK